MEELFLHNVKINVWSFFLMSFSYCSVYTFEHERQMLHVFVTDAYQADCKKNLHVWNVMITAGF